MIVARSKKDSAIEEASSGLFVEPVESFESDPLLESLLSSVRPQNSK